MFTSLNLNADLTRLRQQEMRDMAQKMHQTPRGNGSPVLAAIGRQLVNLGEKLQHTTQVHEQPALNLQTKQA